MNHILEFSSAEQIPILKFRKEGKIFDLELKNKMVLNFSEELLCIGYKNDLEQYKPCVHGQINVRQCNICRRKDVANVYTCGDFSLYPHLKDILNQETYILYLAQFGEDITKIGLTRRSRYLKRWKEQGADFAVAILEFQGPDKAYVIENYISSVYNIPDFVRSNQKFKRIFFNSQKALEKLEKTVKLLSEDFNLKEFWVDENITSLSSFYPKLEGNNIFLADNIEGEIIGAKGNFVFFKKFDQTFAINLAKKIGHFFD
jgi:hypothetical protein